MLPRRQHRVWLGCSALHLKLDERESELGKGEHVQRPLDRVSQPTLAHPWVLLCAVAGAEPGWGSSEATST